MMVFMPHVLASCWKISELNWDPRSEVMVAGMPKFWIHPNVRPSMTLCAEMSTKGTATGHLVNRSTMVSRYLKPFERGNVTRSM